MRYRVESLRWSSEKLSLKAPSLVPAAEQAAVKADTLGWPDLTGEAQEALRRKAV
jgi:hypothetical protein